MGKCTIAFNICNCHKQPPPPPSPPLFIFLLTTEEVLSFKLKYWANLLKLIYFLFFFLLFTFSLPCRKDQFAVLYFIQHVIVLIQVYNWEILQHRTQRFCRCGPVDISYFGRLSAGHKRIAFFSSLKQNMQVQLMSCTTWDQGVAQFNLYQLATPYNLVYMIFQDVYMHVGPLYKTTVCKKENVARYTYSAV